MHSTTRLWEMFKGSTTIFATLVAWVLNFGDGDKDV